MNLILIGWNKKSRILYNLIIEYGGECYRICHIAEPDNNLWTVISDNVSIGSMGKALQMYRSHEADKFLIASPEPASDKYTVIDMLKDNGVLPEDVLYAPIETLENNSISPDKRIGMICAYLDNKELDYMEFHVADHCNLNCKYCSMFSGLVKEPVFADYGKTSRGLRLLKKYFSHIKVFRILGGEPLLNPELDKYLSLVRELYPYSEIRLLTNGILLKNMPEKLIESIKENDVVLCVTAYPVTMDKLEEYNDILNTLGIRHSISDVIFRFEKIYALSGESDADKAFDLCNWKGKCANIRGNYISACFVPFVIGYFEKCFGVNIEKSGVIDLNTPGMTTAKIRAELDKSFDLCSFCSVKTELAKWERMDEDSYTRISDWSV